jgi:LPXTG-motif cell wall-anchored protein
VNSAGTLSALSGCGTGTATGGKLPKTGTDHVFEIVRLALAAFGVGATLLYARRRRVRRTA